LAEAICGFLPNFWRMYSSVGSSGRPYNQYTRPSAYMFLHRSVSLAPSPVSLVAAAFILLIGTLMTRYLRARLPSSIGLAS